MRREFYFEYPTDSQLVGVGVKGHWDQKLADTRLKQTVLPIGELELDVLRGANWEN